MKLTISEELFEEFCAGVGVPCQRIPHTDARTADYQIIVAAHEVVAEVKQLDPTDEDLAHAERVEAGVIEAYGDLPGRRVRRQIDSAKGQIKRQTKGAKPGLLIIYNNVPFMAPLTDPLFVQMAMYGQLAVDMAVPHDPEISPEVIRTRLAGGRRMTDEHNTSISAVCVSQEDWNQRRHRLTFYHNSYAAVPFDPAWLRVEQVAHYAIDDPGSGQFTEWIPL